MSFKKAFLMMVGASAFAAACTPQPQGIQVQPSPQSANGQAADPGAAPTGSSSSSDSTRVVAAVPSGSSTPSTGGSSGSQTTGDASNSGAVGMTLKKSDFANYDASNLSYSFSYLGRTASDKIVFDATNQAVIKITSLPAGQAGSVSLSILQNGSPIMQGSQDNVVLTAGLNNVINLKLKALGVGGSVPGSSTTDLTIDVALDNNTQLPTTPGTVIQNPTQPGTVITTPPSNGGGQPGQVVSNPPVLNNPGPVVTPPVSTNPTDPLASWDGRSFLGNSRWNIVPVQ